jgi:hypothetical protein
MIFISQRKLLTTVLKINKLIITKNNKVLYWREKVELKALTSRSCSTGKQYDKSTLILFDEIIVLCKKAKSKKNLIKHKK